MPSKPDAASRCGSLSLPANLDWPMRREHFGEAMPEASGAFLNEAIRAPSRSSRYILGAGGGLSQQVLEFGEHLFDRIEVGRVFGQQKQLAADLADGSADHRAFVAAAAA